MNYPCKFCGSTEMDGKRCPKAVEVCHPLPRPANPPRPTDAGRMTEIRKGVPGICLEPGPADENPFAEFHSPPQIGVEPYPTRPIPGAPPPPPPPESDPGVPWGDPYVCCWRRLWPWHKHGRA